MAMEQVWALLRVTGWDLARATEMAMEQVWALLRVTGWDLPRAMDWEGRCHSDFADRWGLSVESH